MWFVAAMAWVIVALAVGFVAEALPRGGWRDALANGLLGPGLLSLISAAQVGMISYRRNQTTRFVMQGGRAAAARPSEAKRGLPRRIDFWVILALTVAVSVLIFFVKTHPSA
jgi:hypothetical protein